MSLPSLKINYSDFWKGFAKEDFLTPILKKHFKVEISETPDIVLCSTLHKMANADKYKCPKIVYTAENHRLQGRGHITIGFDHESETNYYMPLWQVYLMLHPEYFDMLANRRSYKHKHFCATVISNEKIPFRNEIFEHINEYSSTLNYGKYKLNTKQIEPRNGDWHNGKISYFRTNQHKFMMAVESSIYPGYCTEKILDAFLCNSIPIYYGDTTVSLWFNRDAFLYYDEKCMEKIKYLDHKELKVKEIMGLPVFNNENKVHENINGFEKSLINGVKQILS